MKALRWMKKNKEWLEGSNQLLSQLPELLSVTCTCVVEIEMEQLLEELKLRQLVEIAPLEPEETPEGHPDEVVWHLDHLDLRPRKYHTSSNFSCGRCLILVIVIMLIVSEVAQVLGFHHKPDYANG